MKIAIDLTPLTSAHKYRGTGSYTRNLVEALQRYEKGHTYTLFTRGQKIPSNIDLVHYPYFDPFFLSLPFFKTNPTVVTVHDLIPMVFPDKFPAGIKGMLKWQIQKASLSGVKRIITDSTCSQNDIAKIMGIDKDHIDVVYLAPDPVFKPADKILLGKTRKKFELTKPYFLYVGDVNWNKNVPGLLNGLASFIKNKTYSEYRLVCVGSAFTDDQLPEAGEVVKLAAALGITQNVLKVGRVSKEDLVALYSGAVALVQPSFYEGFGLSVLEGFASGCPVMSSGVSSLSEIRGPAFSINPADSASITACMGKAADLNDTERRVIITKGFSWVKKFTWQKVARETVASYERALS